MVINKGHLHDEMIVSGECHLYCKRPSPVSPSTFQEGRHQQSRINHTLRVIFHFSLFFPKQFLSVEVGISSGLRIPLTPTSQRQKLIQVHPPTPAINTTQISCIDNGPSVATGGAAGCTFDVPHLWYFPDAVLQPVDMWLQYNSQQA